MNQIKYRKMKNSIFHGVIFCITLIGIVVLVILLADIIMRGVPYLTKHFFTNFPSRFPKKQEYCQAYTEVYTLYC